MIQLNPKERECAQQAIQQQLITFTELLNDHDYLCLRIERRLLSGLPHISLQEYKAEIKLAMGELEAALDTPEKLFNLEPNLQTTIYHAIQTLFLSSEGLEEVTANLHHVSLLKKLLQSEDLKDNNFSMN